MIIKKWLLTSDTNTEKKTQTWILDKRTQGSDSSLLFWAEKGYDELSTERI